MEYQSMNIQKVNLLKLQHRKDATRVNQLLEHKSWDTDKVNISCDIIIVGTSSCKHQSLDIYKVNLFKDQQSCETIRVNQLLEHKS